MQFQKKYFQSIYFCKSFLLENCYSSFTKSTSNSKKVSILYKIYINSPFLFSHPHSQNRAITNRIFLLWQTFTPGIPANYVRDCGVFVRKFFFFHRFFFCSRLPEDQPGGNSSVSGCKSRGDRMQGGEGGLRVYGSWAVLGCNLPATTTTMPVLD